MREQTSADNVAAQNANCAQDACQWRGVRVGGARDANAYIHDQNVHERAQELVYLVSSRIRNNPELGAQLQVCTSNVGIVMQPHATFELRPQCDKAHPVSAAWPTLQDGDAAMACPAMYGLLCTVFEWFRVAIDGTWSVGPYDMRRWDFLNAVAPIPYVSARDADQPQYAMCSRTGFRRWTPSAMLDQLRHRYKVSEHVLEYLEKVVK